MDEVLALLLLPSRLEAFELESQARALLSIPRVLALEPARVRTPKFLRDSAASRQAARLRLPGTLRLLVLYHPAQYPLARALTARFEDVELWYIAADLQMPGAPDPPDLLSLEQLTRDRAVRTLSVADGGVPEEQLLRDRLQELGVISQRAFVPGASFRTRMPRKGSRPGGKAG